MIDLISRVSNDTIIAIKNFGLKSELQDLDFKEIFKISEPKEKFEFIKDFVSFANSTGGYLIYGVTKNFEWIGLDTRSDKNFDSANIDNLLDEFIDGSVNYVSNILEIDQNSFLIMYIAPSLEIIPFKKEGQYIRNSWTKGKQENAIVFRKGDIYCRRGSRSIKADNLFFKQKANNFKIIENVLGQSHIYNEFIGREGFLNDLKVKLKNDNNRIVQIDGIGGIGKTSFVHFFCKLLISEPKESQYFDFIIWTSSKRNKYTPTGIKTINEYISNYSDLIEDINRFMEGNGVSPEEETSDLEKSVLSFLSLNKVLLIVDNLETLNDPELINFLENLPSSSKAILTTRETLGDFYMARINLTGFKEEVEFPEFLNSQYKHFLGQEILFTDLYKDNLYELYEYTKGMPLAGQLIAHQLAKGTPIKLVIQNLKSGDAYHDILSFCFQGSIEKLSDMEKKILYILSLSEREELLSADDIVYISEYNSDEVGLYALPQLSTISLCYSKKSENGEIGYTVPHLAKIYTKNHLKLDHEKEVLTKYEKFVTERRSLLSSNLDFQINFRSNASNHREKLAATQALKAFSISNYNYDLAIATVEKLIAENNKFAFLYLIKAKIQENSQFPDAYDLSKKELKICVELDSTFVDAHIALGFLELKNRVGKARISKNVLITASEHFTKALKLEVDNIRANLGYAQTMYYQAKDISRYHNKLEKINKAESANNYFSKAYYKGENLLPTQIHSNAITAYGQADNYKANLKNNEKAMEVCLYGLQFDSKDPRLNALHKDLLYLTDPQKYSEKIFIQKVGSKNSLSPIILRLDEVLRIFTSIPDHK